MISSTVCRYICSHGSSITLSIVNAAYIGDNHPTELPLYLDTVAMTFNSTAHYSTSGIMAWSEWNSLDHFPRGHGFVRLGPNGTLLFFNECVRCSLTSKFVRASIWYIDVPPDSLFAHDPASPY